MSGLGMTRTVVASLAVLALAGCGGTERSAPADALQRGRALVTAMSARLAAAPALTVSLRGTRTVAGKAEQFSDTIALKRPDRFHSRRLSDLRDIEVWYDGVRVTVAGHRDRGFAQAPMPDTLDRALDAVAERYGLDLKTGHVTFDKVLRTAIEQLTVASVAILAIKGAIDVGIGSSVRHPTSIDVNGIDAN